MKKRICQRLLPLLLVLALMLPFGAMAETAPGFHAEGMPIVDEPVTLSVLTVRWSHMDDSFKNNAFFTQLAKDSNVSLDWQVYSSADWEAVQRPILLASRSLPDVVFGDNVFRDEDYINNLEYFRPLDEYIDKYMPNLKKAFDANPELKRACTFSDGKIYTLPRTLPCRPKVGHQFFINKVWLDNLGLAIPQTTDELTAAMKAFVDEDANGNGDPKDEIPFTAYEYDGLYAFLNLYGMSATDTEQTGYLKDVDGISVFNPVTETYKTAIKWAHQLYADGIIDNEIFTQEESMRMAKIKNPDIPIVGLLQCWTADSELPAFSDQYVPLPALLAPDGNKYASGILNVQRREFAITTFCKYPEVAARWADQFYTDVAGIENFWGPIGDGVIKANADGTYEICPPPEGVSMDTHAWNMTQRDFGPKFVSEEFQKKIILPDFVTDKQKLDLTKELEPYALDAYPLVMYTIEELEEISVLTTDILGYVQTTAAKWVSEGGVDEKWDEYIAQLNAMGLEDLMKIRQAALDRYYGK